MSKGPEVLSYRLLLRTVEYCLPKTELLKAEVVPSLEFPRDLIKITVGILFGNCEIIFGLLTEPIFHIEAVTSFTNITI